MSRILAIDPGTTESAYVVWNGEEIISKGKIRNQVMLGVIDNGRVGEIVVIEQVKSYGMAVGESVFETVFWSGRFAEMASQGGKFDRIPRMDVKMHLCHSPRAKDANITQALIDRFAPNTSNNGKGSKKAGDFPGFFAGFKSDIWQAFALAVCWMDLYGGK